MKYRIDVNVLPETKLKLTTLGERYSRTWTDLLEGLIQRQYNWEYGTPYDHGVWVPPVPQRILQIGPIPPQLEGGSSSNSESGKGSNDRSFSKTGGESHKSDANENNRKSGRKR